MNAGFSLVLVLLLNACLSTQEPDISYPLEAKDDPEYFASYESASKTYEVIYNFEAQFTTDITRLTPAFRAALDRRYEHIWQEKPALLIEGEAKTAFVITIYTANRNLDNIGDPQIWNIQLQTHGKTLKPSAVKPLNPKERWQPLFPRVSQWSKEYLVIFDAAAAANNHLKLILSSPAGSVRSDW